MDPRHQWRRTRSDHVAGQRLPTANETFVAFDHTARGKGLERLRADNPALGHWLTNGVIYCVVRAPSQEAFCRQHHGAVPRRHRRQRGDRCGAHLAGSAGDPARPAVTRLCLGLGRIREWCPVTLARRPHVHGDALIQAARPRVHCPTPDRSERVATLRTLACSCSGRCSFHRSVDAAPPARVGAWSGVTPAGPAPVQAAGSAVLHHVHCCTPSHDLHAASRG